MLDVAARAGFFALGVVIILFVVNDLLVSVVVPRPSPGQWRLSNLMFRFGWRMFRAATLRLSPEPREGLLGAFAPLMVILLLALWVVLLAVGYGFVLWALREQVSPEPKNLGTAMYFSAICLLTLGFGDIVPIGAGARVVALAEAGTGLGSVALVISFLFSLFGAFQRREALVVTMEAAAGAPPSGVALLETARLVKMPELLDQSFEAGKAWSAEVLDSHLAYPPLLFFRSLHDQESWISTLGALLDASTLILTTVEGERQGPAKLMYRVGTHLVEDLSHTVHLEHEHTPGIERFEFDQACDRLQAAGYGLRPRDAAWAAFADLRSTYASPLNVMANRWTIPPAQWIGDRSYLIRRPAHFNHD